MKIHFGSVPSVKQLRARFRHSPSRSSHEPNIGVRPISDQENVPFAFLSCHEYTFPRIKER